MKRHQDRREDAKTKKPEWAREHLLYFALKYVPYQGRELVVTEEGLMEVDEQDGLGKGAVEEKKEKEEEGEKEE